MSPVYTRFFTSFKMQVKRRYLMLLKQRTIEDGLKKRRGECLGCGTCCKSSFPCPFLFEQDRKWLCRIHETKPAVCEIYPFNEKDMFPHAKDSCGYYFVDDKDEE